MSLLREFKNYGFRPLDRVRWASSGLTPGGRSAWLDQRLHVEDRYGWVFVLGVNNSGTTVISRLLQQHSEIRSLPHEGQLLTRAFPRAAHHQVGRLWSQRLDLFRWTEKDDPAPADRAKFDWLRHYPRQSGYLLEKSPPNTLRSRWLQENFRPARFVAIIRHPYATCEGIRRRAGCELGPAAEHWAKSMELMFEDIQHLQQCHWFRYEDLTADPETELGKIEAFLGLSSPLDRSELGKVKVHSIDGKTTGLQNLNDKSLANLTDEDLRTIDAAAGEMMRRLGYEPIRR